MPIAHLGSSEPSTGLGKAGAGPQRPRFRSLSVKAGPGSSEQRAGRRGRLGTATGGRECWPVERAHTEGPPRAAWVFSGTTITPPSSVMALMLGGPYPDPHIERGQRVAPARASGEVAEHHGSVC